MRFDQKMFWLQLYIYKRKGSKKCRIQLKALLSAGWARISIVLYSGIKSFIVALNPSTRGVTVNFNEALQFCRNNPDQDLYALHIEGMNFEHYTLTNVDHGEGCHMMLSRVKGEFFDDLACQDDLDISTDGESVKSLSFFPSDFVGSADEIENFLCHTFPSLSSHTESENGFAMHAESCVRAKNSSVEFG